MNILFGKLTGEYLESYLKGEYEESSVFHSGDGRYYDFSLEMAEHTFTIKDTLGRYVPIGVEEFEEFYKAVKIAREYAKPLAESMHVSDLLAEDETLVV